MHKKFLKKYYFIDKFDKSNIDKQSKNTTIIYRNYQKKYKINEILKLRDYCKKKELNFIISNNINISIKLDLDGVYLPSFNKSFKHLSYALKKKFKLIGSAHNLKEIRIKEKQGVQLIFLSPVFKTKKSNRPLGLYRYNLLANHTKLPTIALGGISINNIKFLKILKTNGFAAISFFNKN